MKILFSMRHPGALRNYTSTLKELARRGHQIHLAFMMQDKLGDGRMLWELTNDHPEITSHELGKKTPWRFWLGLARALRFTTDYVRYFTPEYKDEPEHTRAAKMDARVQGRDGASRARGPAHPGRPARVLPPADLPHAAWRARGRRIPAHHGTRAPAGPVDP